MLMPNLRASVRRPQILVTFACFVLLQGAPAIAQEEDKFDIALGGYSVFIYDSAISLTEVNAGIGASISPRDTLGLDGEQTVFRFDGRYRIKPKHAITFAWYSISSDALKTLTEDIEWVDENGDTVTIPSGTSVDSSLGYDIFKVGYLWSFYRSDKVELAAGAGLHLAVVDVALNVDSGLFDAELRTAKSDLPMPVVTFALDYTISPKFNWFFSAQLFAMEVGDWRGVYSDLQLGMKYQWFEHVGVGAGFGSNFLEVINEEDDTRLEYDNRVTGLHFFISANF